jgi:hypothetical protein
MCLAGAFIGLMTRYGLQIPISETGLSELIGAIIFLILAHIDATHPNTFFNSESDPETEDQEDEYAELDDLDPAGEYE